MAYLTVAEFRIRTLMPSDDIDDLEALRPGYLAECLDDAASWIDARLTKRYAVPFAAPVPRIVLRWLTHIVTLDAYLGRGFNPSSEQDQQIVKRSDDAKAEVLEAADSNEGKFDLPRREDQPGASGIVKATTFCYSEPDAYVWTDVQAERVRNG